MIILECVSCSLLNKKLGLSLRKARKMKSGYDYNYVEECGNHNKCGWLSLVANLIVNYFYFYLFFTMVKMDGLI